jgi:phosphoglycolate phosphatase
MIRAILFDLDGTLVDSVADLRAAANILLSERGLPLLDIATVKGFVGNGIAMLVERCLRHSGAGVADLDGAIGRFRRIYDGGGHLHTALFPAAEAALERLSAGYRLGLCTNKDLAPTLAIVRKLGIAGRFASIIGGDSVGAVKPDPRVLQAAAAGCGARLDECLYVGDSEVDAEAARRAGVPFLLFAAGYRKSPIEALAPFASFERFAELPALVEDVRRGIR